MSLDTCKSQFIALKRDSEQQIREGLRTCLDCNVCKAETFPPIQRKMGKGHLSSNCYVPRRID